MIAELQTTIVSLEKQHTELQLQNQSLQLQLSELRRIIFGSKAEKFVRGNHNDTVVQTQLFLEDKLGKVDLVKTTSVKGYEKQQTKITVQHKGRNPLPDSLRREVTELLPEEDVTGLTPVGKEITERLEYRSGELFVRQFVRPEYIKTTQDGLNAKRVIAPLPTAPLEKSIAGASLLSHLLIGKYVDHLPIYRQLEIFKRQNVDINHSTVSGWITQTMELIKPVYDLHCKEVLKSNYLCVDETTIKVLDKEKKGTTHKGFYWVYYDTQRKLALFDYQSGRGSVYPKTMLQGFSGYLQSDGYDAYDYFDRQDNITALNCWAHAGRKFFEAKDYDKDNAEKILSRIQQLYAIESYVRNEHFTPEQIKAYRTQHSIPILDELHLTLQDIYCKTLPNAPLGKAIAYTLKRWKKLCTYTKDGILQIDNNLVENAIRPVALGRKNYLFAGSHERAQDAAMLYSLFATCRLHNVNPEKWLTRILQNIKNTPKDKLHLLLPQHYAIPVT